MILEVRSHLVHVLQTCIMRCVSSKDIVHAQRESVHDKTYRPNKVCSEIDSKGG